MAWDQTLVVGYICMVMGWRRSVYKSIFDLQIIVVGQDFAHKRRLGFTRGRGIYISLHFEVYEKHSNKWRKELPVRSRSGPPFCKHMSHFGPMFDYDVTIRRTEVVSSVDL